MGERREDLPPLKSSGIPNLGYKRKCMRKHSFQPLSKTLSLTPIKTVKNLPVYLQHSLCLSMVYSFCHSLIVSTHSTTLLPDLLCTVLLSHATVQVHYEQRSEVYPQCSETQRPRPQLEHILLLCKSR